MLASEAGAAMSAGFIVDFSSLSNQFRRRA